MGSSAYDGSDTGRAPSKQRDRHLFDVPFVAPRTPIEKLLADIWAGVLSVDRVGTRDDFFDLGGDSLFAMQVRTRLLEHGIEIKVVEVLQFPTIEQFILEIGLEVSETT